MHRLACYNLEGDGPLAMVAYDEIAKVFHSLEANMDFLASCPNIQLLIRVACAGMDNQDEANARRNQMTTYARDRMLRGYTYFMTHFWLPNAKRYDNLQLFKIYRILNPKHVKSLGDLFTVNFVQSELRQLINNEKWEHILNEEQLQQIIQQTADYRRLCNDENYEDLDYKDILKRIVKFWKTHHNVLSAWWILVERAYLTQPSSCAAERALSVFTRIMTNNMKNSLLDITEGSMMLNINSDEDEITED